MAPLQNLVVHETGLADNILTQIANEDKVKWFKKPTLRVMYLWLFLCCMGVEMTSGFDSALIGTLQFSDRWNKCNYILILCRISIR